MRLRSEQGLSLISVMIAVGLSVIVVAGVSSLVTRARRGQNTFELRADRIELKRLIGGQIDCAGTFATAAIDPAAPSGQCPSSSLAGGQAGPWLKLMRKTKAGALEPLIGNLDASGRAKVGKWSVRASCSEAEQTLVVRVADSSLNWDAAGNLLFGGAAGADEQFPLCFDGPVETLTSDDGYMNVPMTITPIASAAAQRNVVVPILGRPVAAACAPALYGGWPGSYDYRCACDNQNITFGPASITFRVTSAICTAGAPCGSPYAPNPPATTPEVWSRNRGWVIAPNIPYGRCSFNWTMQVAN